MKKEREELRRGIRPFIQNTSPELAELTSSAPPALPQKPPAAREPAPADRPILRLARGPPSLPLESRPPVEDLHPPRHKALRPVLSRQSHRQESAAVVHFSRVNRRCQ